MQVGTYPTRNFAQCCYILERMGEAFLVPLTSARRRAARTISSSGLGNRSSGVWPLRILSTTIHSAGQLTNLFQSFLRQMIASLHHGNHLGKTLETRSFHRAEWMFSEELHDFHQLLDSSDSELFPITMIRGDLPESEELVKSLQNRNIALMLHHSELGKNLPPDCHAGLPVHSDEEAAFSVDESDHPFCAQSFLLVVCTGWIFTRIEYHRILQIFQHTARCAACHCWQAGLAMNLRTVH